MAMLEQTVDVNVAPDAAYSMWQRVEDYPRFMEGVTQVRRAGENRVHWHARRHEHDVEWDSEITESVPNQLIRWRDLGGQYHGSLTFEPLAHGQTRVRMHMEFDALPVDKEQALTTRVAGDLERFKAYAEAGAGSGSRNAAGEGGEARQDEARQDEARQDEARQDETRQDGARQDSGRGPQAWLRSQFANWDDPIALVRKVSEEVDQLFARFIGRPIATKSGEGGQPGKWMPPVEILQRGQLLVICVDLPGISRESIDVEIQRDRVIVEGERKETPQPADAPGFRRSERSYGPFHRTVPLPEGVDPDSAHASMRDGVLEIALRMPTPEERRGKRLDIAS
jgi:HSP20 family molecular chaperone IbpA/ribosome-associated toxin RatA of RatAB toxin-antitoxin module